MLHGDRHLLLVGRYGLIPAKRYLGFFQPLKYAVKSRVIEQAAIYCQKLVPCGVIVWGNCIRIYQLRLAAPSLQIAQEDAGEGASIKSVGDDVDQGLIQAQWLFYSSMNNV
ncbi:hypothetical protein C7B64_23725 [Merismopedia glauca CCAP 1448/3]|uniref:Uncharacterized protein n=1 Tax=Merismopedia glauca CCAP 1448/3 TaxID=1296344 RepID=A0A2T1BWV7_9CYAN|nr:hypothetical protein C7B64_23725 [Merismopedia glauca CCAP 1448/3]